MPNTRKIISRFFQYKNQTQTNIYLHYKRLRITIQFSIIKYRILLFSENIPSDWNQTKQIKKKCRELISSSAAVLIWFKKTLDVRFSFIENINSPVLISFDVATRANYSQHKKIEMGENKGEMSLSSNSGSGNFHII